MKINSKTPSLVMIIVLSIAGLFSVNVVASNSNSSSHGLNISQITTPIIIGSGNFSTVAGTLGINGSGTYNDPYIISGANITGTGVENLISISDTTDYFIIEKSTLSGGLNGIFLDNSDNGYILNNTITGNYQTGISFINSFNTRVEVNEISDNGSGCGSRISLSQIRLNGHAGAGILYDPSGDSFVLGNNIFDNYVSGIIIEDGTNITIQGNTIESNGGVCPLLSNSLDLNQINHRDGYGIDIQQGSGNKISKNEISYNAHWGITTEENSVDNSIRDNNFINNDYKPQASDNGTRNIYDGNYWSDLSGNQYNLAGLMNNTDYHPKNSENLIYFDQRDFFPNRTIERVIGVEKTPLWAWFVIFLLGTLLVLIILIYYRERR